MSTARPNACSMPSDAAAAGEQVDDQLGPNANVHCVMPARLVVLEPQHRLGHLAGGGGCGRRALLKESTDSNRTTGFGGAVMLAGAGHADRHRAPGLGWAFRGARGAELLLLTLDLGHALQGALFARSAALCAGLGPARRPHLLGGWAALRRLAAIRARSRCLFFRRRCLGRQRGGLASVYASRSTRTAGRRAFGPWMLSGTGPRCSSR